VWVSEALSFLLSKQQDAKAQTLESCGNSTWNRDWNSRKAEQEQCAIRHDSQGPAKVEP